MCAVHQKKSLFAQHFESLDSKEFGVAKSDDTSLRQISFPTVTKKDCVEPLNIEPVNFTRPSTEKSRTTIGKIMQS